MTAIRAVTPEDLMLGEIVEGSNRPGNRAVGQPDQATSWPAHGCIPSGRSSGKIPSVPCLGPGCAQMRTGEALR